MTSSLSITSGRKSKEDFQFKYLEKVIKFVDSFVCGYNGSPVYAIVAMALRTGECKLNLSALCGV